MILLCYILNILIFYLCEIIEHSLIIHLSMLYIIGVENSIYFIYLFIIIFYKDIIFKF